jgi:protocatechuate 3,4-dioxygenase beta subunit
MDNDDQTVGRILNRREALRVAAGAGLVLLVGGRGRAWSDAVPGTQPAVQMLATPALTEGPFFVDERLNRSDLVAGTTRAAVTGGLPLALSFTLLKLSGPGFTPLSGAQLDVWSADASGAYSDESNPMNRQNTAGQHWLRGYQITDASGSATFRTILPGWYNGRAPHIHFKVRQFNSETTRPTKQVAREFTSQLFLSDADRVRIYSQPPYNTYADGGTTNAEDDIFNQRQPDGRRAGDLLTLNLQPGAGGVGHAAHVAIALTDSNLVIGGWEHHGGPGGPGGHGGPGGPPPGDMFGPPPWW